MHVLYSPDTIFPPPSTLPTLFFRFVILLHSGHLVYYVRMCVCASLYYYVSRVHHHMHSHAVFYNIVATFSLVYTIYMYKQCTLVYLYYVFVITLVCGYICIKKKINKDHVPRE